ncbi:MAG: amidase [Thermoleophilia bacterium]|nr:amidase [Thermoleophilia bacterium]
MSVPLPTPEQIKRIAEDLGLALTEDELSIYLGKMGGDVAAYNLVDSMPDNLPVVKYPRTPGYRPSPEENPRNAWYYKSTVPGAPRGRLKGRSVVIKDNIMVAGVPMMNGASTLEGYIPEIDATVVTRVLDDGGTVVGKAHCESFCLSGGSHTNATGPVHNPFRMGYSAGGSSSGCAVLVVLGEVDMAIGCDQGGSIRIPASFCGAYGMKPTYGLVPYTGIMPIEITVDHVGPITANVADNALLLEVLAGNDGLDPRQVNVRTRHYSEALGRGVDGMKIGVVHEGFAAARTESDVEHKVRAAARLFEELGATVGEVSIPWHAKANAVWIPIGVGGLTQTMMEGDGFGVSHSDLYVTSLMDHHRGWRHRADELSASTKRFLLLGTYINQHYGTRYYGKAMNISRSVRAAYDAVLAQFDLLLMPTTPMKATPLPAPDAPLEEYLRRADEPATNTMPFNLTHHPALSLPCGLSDGLPVGMMLVSEHWGEPAIYRAAHAFEQAVEWRGL